MFRTITKSNLGHFKGRRQFFNWKLLRQKQILNLVVVGNVSAPRTVPENITKPPYILSGKYPNNIFIQKKLQAEIVKLQTVCQLARNTLNKAASVIQVGRLLRSVVPSHFPRGL